ncbi:zinc carboxypeptidase [Episyrphus balteatus]|uniref:zinc carboxypeptidase n=1 Tax=Episyrphus balteatus TaxID=286459 RepID=UPI0024860239|nr:zinc carboxypeptidase [Episyrphus balteatus]
MRIAIGLLLIALLSVSAEEPLRFDNYKVYKLFINEDGQYQSLKNIEKTFKLNFWKEIRSLGEDCDVMVPPEKVLDFEKFLQKSSIGYNLTINNVQELIDNERPKARSAGMEWTDYHSLEEIHAWVESLAQRFPKQVSLFSIGKSFEGRNIKGLKISYKPGNKAVFIEANIHAREWITSAVITYIIDELLVSRHPAVRDIAENIDWYIIPVLNVDGFVYSHEVDRMWRKSRQGHGNKCIGTDMNRNFGFLWMSAGASNDSCSETYAGPFAQSEPEINQLVDYVQALPDDYIKIYISLHSYGQYVLSPWGHTEELPPDYDAMMHVAKGYADSLKRRYGTVFTYGSSALTLYKVSGSGKEWAYAVKGIPIPYTIELRDKGTYGFILPPEQILPTAKEVLEGFIGMIHAAREINIV